MEDFLDTIITEQRLLDQKRLIMKSELLVPLELDRIKQSSQFPNSPPLTPASNVTLLYHLFGSVVTPP